jgi:hypothetical protein
VQAAAAEAAAAEPQTPASRLCLLLLLLTVVVLLLAAAAAGVYHSVLLEALNLALQAQAQLTLLQPSVVAVTQCLTHPSLCS